MSAPKPSSHYYAVIEAIKELDRRLQGNRLWTTSDIKFSKKKTKPTRRKMKKNANRI